MKPIVLIVSILYITVAGCQVNGNTDTTKNKLAAFPVLKLETKDTIVEQEYVADIQASKNVEIRAKITGFIEKILVDEGQEVTKGQPLFAIENAEFQTEVAKAAAALSNARAEAKAAQLELARIKILVDKNVISKTEYELGEARLKSALAKVDGAVSDEETARIKLSYTYIRSPFNGIIDRIPQKRGSLVNEGTLLTTISDLESMYAYFAISESEYLKYTRDKKEKKNSAFDDIKLVLADNSIFPYSGKVETMESEFDNHTGSIAFRATFPNPDKLLKHGASGKILLESTIPDALMIPQKAVMEIQDKNFVFVLEKDNTVKMKSFSAGSKFNEFVFVEAGLSENDTIVYEGIQNIREGTRITPQFIVMDSLTAISYAR